MSALRDVRLLIAKDLDVEASIKSAVLHLISTIDLVLDTEGFENTKEIKEALAMLERAIVNDAIPDYLTDEDEDLLEDDGFDFEATDEEDED